MELHIAENYYHILGCCEATCSFHQIYFGNELQAEIAININ